MPMTEDQQKYQQRSARIYQSQYDDVLRRVGMRAPQPVLGQHPDDYRRETLRTLKKTFLQNHELSRVNMRGLELDILQAIEPQVINAAVTEAYKPDNVPPGEMRKVEDLDEYGKVRSIKFIGRESFVKEMGRPGRRVISFRTDQLYRCQWESLAMIPNLRTPPRATALVRIMERCTSSAHQSRLDLLPASSRGTLTKASA